MTSVAEFAPFFFLGVGVAGFLLWVAAWTKLVWRARHGRSNESMWWFPRSPGGRKLFARHGQAIEVEDYVPADVLASERDTKRHRPQQP